MDEKMLSDAASQLNYTSIMQVHMRVYIHVHGLQGVAGVNHNYNYKGQNS